MISTMHSTALPAAERRSSLAGRLLSIHELVASKLQTLSPVAQLALRLYVANVFIASGMTKIQSWPTTLQLFEYEYHVPLLPPAIAAYAGTFTELFFPVLLALGLGGRVAAFVLFVFNIIAVISYPDLNAAGIEQHKVWGLMLFALLMLGPGRLSIDHWIRGLISRRI